MMKVFSLLDPLPVAALLFGVDGSIVRANAPARAMLSVCSPRPDRCNGADCPVSEITEALDAIPLSAPLAVILHPGGIPARVLVLRLGGTELPHALALLFQDDGQSRVVDRDLCRLFNLTPAEGKLAAYLVGNGGSLRDFAEQSNVSINTVRTHLKRIFAKMGASSQADLVRKIYAEATQTPRCANGGSPTAIPSLACARLPVPIT